MRCACVRRKKEEGDTQVVPTLSMQSNRPALSHEEAFAVVVSPPLRNREQQLQTRPWVKR